MFLPPCSHSHIGELKQNCRQQKCLVKLREPHGSGAAVGGPRPGAPPCQHPRRKGSTAQRKVLLLTELCPWHSAGLQGKVLPPHQPHRRLSSPLP